MTDVWVPGVWAAGLTWAVVALWWWFVGTRVVLDRLRDDGPADVSRPILGWWGVVAGAFGLWLSVDHPSSAAVVGVSLLALGSILTDVRVHRLPNPLTAVMAVSVMVGITMYCWSQHSVGVAMVAVLGAGIWALPLLLGYVAKAGVGLGDVKLAPVLGAMVGLVSLEAAVAGLALAFVGAGVAALFLMITRKATVRTRLAMGPWLIGGALLSWWLWANGPAVL